MSASAASASLTKLWVKRNADRFPSDFMFQLDVAEFESLRSQIVTSKGRGGRRVPPYAFTEQGVEMLSSVLRSSRLAGLERRYDRQFKAVFDAIRQLMREPQAGGKRQIGFVRDEKGS